MAGGLELVRDCVTRLEALVSATPDETRSLADRLDAVALREYHEKIVAESETRFTEMMGDMTTLGETLRENLHDVEFEISFVKKVVTGSAYSANVSYKVKVPEPKSFGGARSAKELEFFTSRLHAFQMVTRFYSLVCISLETQNSSGKCKWVMRHVS